MASNPYVNKVVYGSTTLVDLTGTTATADKILQGYGAYGADGAWMDGTATAGSGSAVVVTDTPDSHGGTIREITAVSLEGDTVSAATLLQGYTAHNSLGQQITGTYVPSGSAAIEASKEYTVSGAGSTTISPDAGYDAVAEVDLTVPAGSATPASSISATGATVSTGTNTLTLSKSVSNTPQVSAGYVSSGTAGNSSVSLTASITTKAAATINTSTSDQTIAAGTYLTGAQTIKAVTTTNLTAANIKSGVTVQVGDANDSDRVLSITGTYAGGGSVQTDTKTETASNYPTSLSFTGMKGEPKMFTVRLNAQVSSSGSTTYYYIVDITSHGTTTHGNCFRIGNTRRVDNITSGYSWSYSGTTLTITSNAASRSASPGAFYNGSYELMYVY